MRVKRSGAKFGGERGIRTHGRVAPTHAFQACSFNHSDISPHVENQWFTGEWLSQKTEIGSDLLMCCDHLQAQRNGRHAKWLAERIAPRTIMSSPALIR